MNEMPLLRSPDSQAISESLQDAAHAFFPEATEVAAIDGHPELARVSAPSGLWGVRRWPEGTPQSDVAFSHEVMNTARSAGLAVVPALHAPPDAPSEPALRLGNRLYDARRWLPGEPPPGAEIAWPGPEERIDVPLTVTPGAFAAAITALARLHEATGSLAATPDIPTAPLDMLPGAVRQAQERHMAALRSRARHEPSIQRWLATSERLLASAEPMILAASTERALSSAVLHLNCWPAHILIDNGDLVGVLGWERVAAGSPLLDIAQATLRLRGWHDDAVEEALGAYGDERELAPQERRLLPAVAALDAVASTGRLLEQTYSVPDTARPPTALRAAIEMMLRSMAALDRNLSTPEKRRGRVWNRQRPSPGGRARGGKSRERRH